MTFRRHCIIFDKRLLLVDCILYNLIKYQYKGEGFRGRNKKICQYLRIGIFLFAPIIYYILYHIGVVGSDIIRLVDKGALYLALGINCPNRKLVAVFVEKI